MSAPNKSYDPVEVAALAPEALERHREEALDAIRAASTLEELKEVRIAHAGDRSPLALANREIGALPPTNRKAVPWTVAVNGVMAGCEPCHMPVLMAAVRALCDPLFNIMALADVETVVKDGTVVKGGEARSVRPVTSAQRQ